MNNVPIEGTEKTQTRIGDYSNMIKNNFGRDSTYADGHGKGGGASVLNTNNYTNNMSNY